MLEKTRQTRKIQKQEKKPLLNKKLLAISIILAITIIVGAVLYQYIWRNQEAEVKFSLKAAIIDQLSKDFYNQTFVETLTNILNEAMFKVEYYNYTKTNVEFFKGLAKGNYGIIILRTHAALRKNGSTVDFFTSEKYVANHYKELQDKGLLVVGELNISGTIEKYFALTPEFVENLEGNFPKSIVIAMGCQTLNETAGQPMAKAFCDIKSAKVYIGWSSWVSVKHSDEETIKLVSRLLRENKTIGGAIKDAKRDPNYGAYLKFYPESARDLRVSSLIEEAKTSGFSVKSTALEGFYIDRISPVKRFNSLATVMYSWFRRFSPVRFAVFNFLTSSASTASSRTSFIHFSKSPR
jgi:hypothetical protein